MSAIAPPALPKPRLGASGYYMIYLVLMVLPVCIFGTLFTKIILSFKDILKDFKIALPPLTEYMMSLSDMISSGGWIVILLVALAVPVWPARVTARQSSRLMRANHFFLALNLVFFFNLIAASLVLVALCQPLIKLVRAVSGGDPGSGE